MKASVFSIRRILSAMIVALAILTPPPASAEGGGGAVFADVDRVYRESKTIGAIREKINEEFRDRDQVVRALVDEVKAARERLQKESLTMSDSEKRELRRAIEQKELEFNRGSRALREDRNLRFNEHRRRLDEMILQAVRTLAKERGYEMVLFRDALIHGAESSDITTEVIAALDALSAE